MVTFVVDTLSVLLGIAILSLITVNTGLCLKTWLAHPGLSSLQLLIISMLVSFWALAGSLFIAKPVLPGNPSMYLPVLFSAGLVCLFAALIGLSRMLATAFYGKFPGFLINAAAVLHAITAGLAVADAFLEHPLFFSLSFTAGSWKLTMHPYSIAVTFVAVTLTAVSVSSSIIIQNPVREYFYTGQKRFKWFFTSAFTVCLTVTVTSFTGSVLLQAISFITGQLITTLSVLGLFFLIFYLSVTQPLFLMLSGADPAPFLEQGYIGYFFGTFTDEGPVPTTVSPVFKERMHLSDLALLHLTLKVITVVGTDASASFQHEAAVIHVPVTATVNLLGVFFNSRNLEAKDTRLHVCAPSAAGILFPVVLNETFQHVFSILPVVMGRVFRKTVTELDDHAFLEELARAVLKKLLD